MQLTTLIMPFLKPVFGGYLTFLITVCPSYLSNLDSGTIGSRVFFFGGKPTHIQKSKQLPVLVISNPPGCRKEPEKDGQFFWSAPQIV
jgi:hypothetical protein